MPLPEIPLTDSTHGALLVATKQALIGLTLPGIQNERWYDRKQLWDIGLKDKTPCGILAPATKGYDWKAGEVESEDVEYGIAIAFVAAGNYDMQAGMGCMLVWPERAAAQLMNHRLDGLALPAGKQQWGASVVAPSETFLQAAAKIGWDAQYLIVRYTVREQRDDA